MWLAAQYVCTVFRHGRSTGTWPVARDCGLMGGRTSPSLFPPSANHTEASSLSHQETALHHSKYSLFPVVVPQ